MKRNLAVLCYCPDCVGRMVAERRVPKNIAWRILEWWQSLDPKIRAKIWKGEDWRKLVHPELEAS